VPAESLHLVEPGAGVLASSQEAGTPQEKSECYEVFHSVSDDVDLGLYMNTLETFSNGSLRLDRSSLDVQYYRCATSECRLRVSVRRVGSMYVFAARGHHNHVHVPTMMGLDRWPFLKAFVDERKE
jgi:hypothetical protein